MKHVPLAERMRPATLEEFVGQEHILGKGRILEGLLSRKKLPSLILWGPPGCGKTTLAKLIAQEIGARFTIFSAVLQGVKELRLIVEEAKRERSQGKRPLILFVDEIHRFNKAQQDAFLPHVESGLIILIGATTENPSFEIIPPLLSRCRVIMLEPLSAQDLTTILHRALEDSERGLGSLGLRLNHAAAQYLVESSDGDARNLLNNLEVVAEYAASLEQETHGMEITVAMVEEAVQQRPLRYDKQGEEHYNLISAFHKSLRGSDPDAALYWLARMLSAGESPHYIARRMVRFASEDVGMADPLALQTALAALQAYDFLGSPEGELALAQAAVYLATAPKSNSIYTAFGSALADARKHGSLPVPMHIRNAPTPLMKRLGYGKGYKYAHDFQEAVVDQEYMPTELRGRIYYKPSTRGYERTVAERLERWRRILAKRRKARG